MENVFPAIKMSLMVMYVAKLGKFDFYIHKCSFRHLRHDPLVPRSPKVLHRIENAILVFRSLHQLFWGVFLVVCSFRGVKSVSRALYACL